MTPDVHGDHQDRFAPVVEAFRAHLATTPYGGAALAVYLDGEPVIDVWGGLADPIHGREWSRDDLTMAFSCTKSVSAIIVMGLVEDGLLDLDEPVATYWPEFKQNGKESVTLRHVLAHRAGVPLVDAPLALDDVVTTEPLLRAIEAQAPLWTPGDAHAYHAITVGHITGEVVRRVTGKTLGALLQHRYAEPLGLDLWIGTPTTEHHRVVPTLPADPAGYDDDFVVLMRQALNDDDRALRALSYNGAFHLPIVGVKFENSTNLPEVREAEMPAANGIGTARAFAKLHAALVSTVEGAEGPLLRPETLDEATRVQSAGEPFFGLPVPPFPSWGTGFMVPWELRPMLGPTSFGHDGAAGGMCFADRESRVGFAFLPSVMGPMPEVRMNPIVEQLRFCLA